MIDLDEKPSLGRALSRQRSSRHEGERKGRFKSTLAPPIEPAYSRFFLGGYKEGRILPFKGDVMKWAIQLIAGLAILFYGYDQGEPSHLKLVAIWNLK